MKAAIRLKLFLGSLALIGTAIVIAEAYLSAALEDQLTERIREDLLVRARLIAERFAAAPSIDSVTADPLADDLGRSAGVRVTLVRADGSVAGDSEVDPARLQQLENHAERPEIVQAMSHGQGSAVRRSATLGQRLMYAAVPVTRAGAVVGAARVALPLTQIDEAIWHMRRTLGAAALVALAIGAVASLSAAGLMSRRLRALTDAAMSMTAGNLSIRTRAAGHDEIAALGNALDQLAESLTQSLGDLRGERDLLNGILSSMNEGVLVTGSGGRIVLTNPALRAMLLIGPDAVGKSVLQVIRNSDLTQLIENAAHAGSAEGDLELSGLMPRRMLVRAVRLHHVSGGVLGVFVDVTELKRLEAVRRDFVANASHELRSPLTTIRAAAETLHSVADDAKARERFTALIERNSERLANLIDDLLELSRIESRELKLELTDLDLASVIERVTAQYAARAQLKQMELSREVPAGTIARADRRAFEHALGNLIDNALKYGQGTGHVHVSVRPEDDIVRVSVRDSGPGIAPEHLSRIFERFYRIDAGRSRELGGTGLGLSIVKHLVEAMGGTVAVESRPGVGSIFSFTLQRV